MDLNTCAKFGVPQYKENVSQGGRVRVRVSYTIVTRLITR